MRRLARRSGAGRCALRGVLLVAARPPRRSGQLQPRHQAIELRELVRLELVEALLAEPLLVAGDQRRHLELGRILVTLVARARRWAPIDRTRRDVLLGIVILGLPRLPKTEKNTASNASTCAGSETNTARAVQYSRRREIGRTSVSASAKSDRPAGRDRHAGIAQAPAQRADERRQVELDRLDAERRPVSHRHPRAAPGRPRGSPPGPRCTSAPIRA